ncbi:hypothetical protein [Sulfurospirillum arcachonense]|uniref:hypothetical protein n=1 Tax=Sulfurospirillum arcachonense TaxID=57666 RepID=UPI000469DFCA|nr:hypothetical protein [Sulfurospirillum arcachonense]
MFSTDDIIELENKWLKYKIKQKSKFYILLILLLFILSVIVYNFIKPKPIKAPAQIVKPKLEKIVKQPIIEENNATLKSSKENNTTLTLVSTKNEKNNTQKEKNITIKKEKTKPYHFQLEPRDQVNELFSSNGFLVYNSPFKEDNIEQENNTYKVIEPIRNIEKEKISTLEKTQKHNISIDMKEMDTIAYLKEKYYSTSSIVFALMLSEEYYYAANYEDSLKWALTANDIDSQNTKTWYWFAKSKVKLNQKEDAIKALKAYLANNESKRLKTLLQKIELGDTDD